MKQGTAKLQLLGAMGIFGTIGIFTHYIPLPSAVIACLRGVLGVAFLLLIMLVMGKKPDWKTIRQKLLLLCVSGAAIGFNWVLLFEGYRYSVPTATVCYYMAPLFMILASPLVGEKLNGRKLACVAVALTGMVLVSGILQGLQTSGMLLYAVLFGLGAAVLYASVILMNRKLGRVAAYDRTVIQIHASRTETSTLCAADGRLWSEQPGPDRLAAADHCGHRPYRPGLCYVFCRNGQAEDPDSGDPQLFGSGAGHPSVGADFGPKHGCLADRRYSSGPGQRPV